MAGLTFSQEAIFSFCQPAQDFKNLEEKSSGATKFIKTMVALLHPPYFHTLNYVLQGANKKKMDPLFQKFTLFYTIFTAFFIIFTVTLYSQLKQNNLLLACSVKNFKYCLVKSGMNLSWRGSIFLFEPCNMVYWLEHAILLHYKAALRID